MPQLPEDHRRTEVDDAHVHVAIGPAEEEDVVGLEIAMNDLGVVRRAQRRGDLEDDLHAETGREGTARLDRAGERLADELLHDEVRHVAVESSEVGDGDDVRMPHHRRRPRLPQEARGEIGIAREIAPQHLEREEAIERPVAHAVHRAHAPFAEDARDLVAVVDDSPDQRVGGGLPDAGMELRAVEGAERGVGSETLVALPALHGRAAEIERFSHRPRRLPDPPPRRPADRRPPAARRRRPART